MSWSMQKYHEVEIPRCFEQSYGSCAVHGGAPCLGVPAACSRLLLSVVFCSALFGLFFPILLIVRVVILYLFSLLRGDSVTTANTGSLLWLNSAPRRVQQLEQTNELVLLWRLGGVACANRVSPRTNLLMYEPAHPRAVNNVAICSLTPSPIPLSQCSASHSCSLERPTKLPSLFQLAQFFGISPGVRAWNSKVRAIPLHSTNNSKGCAVVC